MFTNKSLDWSATKAACSQRRRGNDIIADALRFLRSSKIARSHETAVLSSESVKFIYYTVWEVIGD